MTSAMVEIKFFWIFSSRYALLFAEIIRTKSAEMAST